MLIKIELGKCIKGGNMAEVEWIKIVTEFFDDDKIKLIENTPEADMILIIWIKLLTLAGKKNHAGYIFLTEKIPYNDEMLATIFNRPLNTIRLALATFKRLEMIIIDEAGIIKIINWEKHQNIEGMERIRELGRARLKKFRDKNKQIEGPKKECNVTETFRNGIDKIRIEKNREEKENSKEIQNAISRSLEEKPIKPKIEPIEFDREIYSWHGINDKDIEIWEKAFPNINIGEQLMLIREYFKKNSKAAKDIEERFKNRFGIYIYDWMERAEKYRIKDSKK